MAIHLSISLRLRPPGEFKDWPKDLGKWTSDLVAQCPQGFWKGDRFDGPRGSVTLASLCAAWGLPAERAAGAPVLADRRGVLAVLGAAVGGATAVRGTGPLPGEECLLVRIPGGAKERRA